MRLVILIVMLILFWVCLPVWAQTDFGVEGGFGDRYFFVDCASFREDRGERYEVEICYKIYNPKLTFVKSKGGFSASYELNLGILHKGGEQVASKSIDNNYSVSSYDNSVSSEEYLVGISRFSLYSGEYTLVAKLVDHNSRRTTTLKKNFVMPSRLKKGTVISDILISTSAQQDSSENDFVKLGKSLIPSVSNILGENDSTMFAYFEVYPDPRKPRPCFLVYRISGSKQVKSEEKDSLKIAQKMLAQIKRFEVQELLAGDYVLSISAYSDNGKLLAESGRNFRIEWSPLSLLRRDYDEAIRQLKYIAEEEEMDRLEKVEPQDREQAWSDFWKSKDPTPDTQDNEMKDEYYKRLNYANVNFGIYGKEGWETDMGMVYITYGYPDEMEKHYFDRETDQAHGEYMIWYYFRLRPERRFLFKDYGYGEYRLEYPYDGIQRHHNN